MPYTHTPPTASVRDTYQGRHAARVQHHPPAPTLSPSLIDPALTLSPSPTKPALLSRRDPRGGTLLVFGAIYYKAVQKCAEHKQMTASKMEDEEGR